MKSVKGHSSNSNNKTMIRYFISILFRRSSKYLMLTFLSIVVGAFLFGGTFSLTRSISTYFIEEWKTLIGADVVISGARPIDIGDALFQSLKNDAKATIIEEVGVQAVFTNAQTTSTAAASIRAVDAGFPLYGEMVTAPAGFALMEDGIYAESSFLDKIWATVGDTVTLGSTRFMILGTIIQEPDAISTGVSFTPQIIMRRADLAKTDIDLTKSRTSYKVFIRENPLKVFNQENRALLGDYAREKKLRFEDASNGPNNYIRGLSSVISFIGIVIAIALFLVAVNIIANLTYILSRFQKAIALLKTFGATDAQIQIIYLCILGLIGFVAGWLGAGLGWLWANTLLSYFSKYVSVAISHRAIWPVVFVGWFVGLSMVVSSALPFFRSLRDVSPKQLLTKASSAQKSSLAQVLIYTPIPIVLGSILYILSSSISGVIYGITGLIVLFLLFMWIARSIIHLSYQRRENLSFTLRSSASSLSWRWIESVIIIASIMTAFTGVFIISAIEHNISTNINQNISNKAPALYLVDITKSQLDDVRQIAWNTFNEYPIIRGRLLTVNNRDMTQSQDPGVTREFNMTYRNNLIPQEKVIQGEWHGAKNLTNSVSIDGSFAQDIGGVNIGDTIKVFIQGLNVEATVTSIRSTDRSSGTPFFFLVFSSDVLEKFPASYFATADIGESEIAMIEKNLGEKYPNIIPIRTDKIVGTVTGLIDTLVKVVKVISIPSILLGLLLVMVMTGQSLYERRGDVLVFRAFGLSSRSIVSLFITEISVIIMIASIVAYIIAHALAYGLNRFLFSFDIFVFDSMPLWITAGILIVVSIFAGFIASSLVRAPLRDLLSEK